MLGAQTASDKASGALPKLAKTVLETSQDGSNPLAAGKSAEPVSGTGQAGSCSASNSVGHVVHTFKPHCPEIGT